MRYYEAGDWGFSLVWGITASVFPRALVMAIPNAIFAYFLATVMGEHSDYTQSMADNAMGLWGAYTSVLFFVLYFRSNVAYNRWWEGGTLLQQTRGEWFNAYSSLIAFVSSDPKKEEDVEAYQHMLARLMSLLFCSALQQVSPDRSRTFDIIDCTGIDPASMSFLLQSEDKVEVLLQWLQRSTILSMQNGVLTAPPPVMSRAFQELSRGIVNLQNARKIADFPFPFPHAQASMVMLLLHWAVCPVVASILLNRTLAAITCFVVIFFLWCINFIALDLEYPFGSKDNDLPMDQMQSDWNKSVATLLHKRANQPPRFDYFPEIHNQLATVKSSRGQTIYSKGPLMMKKKAPMVPCPPALFRKQAPKTGLPSNKDQEYIQNRHSCNGQDNHPLPRTSSGSFESSSSADPSQIVLREAGPENELSLPRSSVIGSSRKSTGALPDPPDDTNNTHVKAGHSDGRLANEPPAAPTRAVIPSESAAGTSRTSPVHDRQQQTLSRVLGANCWWFSANAAE